MLRGLDGSGRSWVYCWFEAGLGSREDLFEGPYEVG